MFCVFEVFSLVFNIFVKIWDHCLSFGKFCCLFEAVVVFLNHVVVFLKYYRRKQYQHRDACIFLKFLHVFSAVYEFSNVLGVCH